MNIFDTVSSALPVDWQPQAPRTLSGIDEIELDCETNGLRWWAGDLPVGIGICLPDGTTQYLPWGHKGGGNLNEEVVKRWAKRELRNKRITNLSTRFDVHMLREWGVDLEEQGCIVADVGHYAALLDDSRQKFSLESLVNDFLEGEQKVKQVGHIPLDATRMAHYHAGIVAVRAEADARQVHKLKKKFLPRLDAEDLNRVRKLEEDLIYVVCEMERNGTLIDIGLLDTWVQRSERELNDMYRELSKLIGARFQDTLFEGGRNGGFINTNSPVQMERLFHQLNLPITKTETGRPSFTNLVLKAIDHPAIKLVLRINQLQSLRSKYLLPYAETVDRSTGILRYALHQLRSQKDPWDDHAAGTISGRFSSTKIDGDEGMNIQQIMKVAKQRVAFGYHEDDASHDDELYIIRQLHIAPPGYKFLSADAMQIEYRLFAHYTKSERLLKAYEEDPLTSFHRMMHAMMLVHKPTLTYRRQKDCNFAKIYGAGLRKMALMMEFITKEQYFQLLEDKQWRQSPLMKEVIEIEAIYNREIPEVLPLLDGARKLAERRGYVRSLLGRRTRFPDGRRSHKALNAVIQPSAADINKIKLVELRKIYKESGFVLCFTVHDEVDGYTRDDECTRMVNKVLNQQSVDTRVPILWEVGIGPNWAQTVDQKPIFPGVAA